jgi:hypothetical protein
VGRLLRKYDHFIGAQMEVIDFKDPLEKLNIQSTKSDRINPGLEDDDAVLVTQYEASDDKSSFTVEWGKDALRVSFFDIKNKKLLCLGRIGSTNIAGTSSKWIPLE